MWLIYAFLWGLSGWNVFKDRLWKYIQHIQHELDEKDKKGIML